MQNTFLKSQNITATSYYGIENVLPDIISQLHHFLGGAISATYWCQECGSGLWQEENKTEKEVRGKKS